MSEGRFPDTIELSDARRLTGINVVWSEPSAVLDLRMSDTTHVASLFSAWKAALAELCDALNWGQPQSAWREFKAGASFVFSAPVDRLYVAIEIARLALFTVAKRHALNLRYDEDEGPISDDDDQAIAALKTALAEERHPPTLELQAETLARSQTFLWDDDIVSVGLGKGSQQWPADQVPDSVDWSSVHDVPVALVTGTNGKTTTVRLASRILRAAGHRVGLSSTDWIGVDDDIIDRGDYSGPGGARTVLRDTRVDVAILETARGGLLRRGLGVDYANAALITNIAEDHLGEFGAQDVGELLNVKWVIMKALGDGATAVLNADDSLLREQAKTLSVPIIWFSLQSDNPLIEKPTASGGTACILRDETLGFLRGTRWQPLLSVDDVPITMHGVARHNCANALAAAALCHSLGASDEAIRQGLQEMQPNDNPGRCNVFHVDGYEVLLDFAHNPDAMAALFDIAEAHPAKRRVLCFGQAGDRTDAQIRELAQAAWSIGLDRVVISELAEYRRGREPGEVPRLLSEALVGAGAQTEQIHQYATEAESLADAMNWCEPGDLVIMLALGKARELIDHLQSRTTD